MCDASQRYTLTPWPICVLSFSFRAWSRSHRANRSPHTILLLILHHLLLHLLAPSSSPSLTRSRSLPLAVAAALSNGRCNIQRLLAVTRGGGSLGWLCWPVLVASPRKKRAPRGRSLGPSNWRRCPSTGARAIASLSLFPLVPPSFRLRPLRRELVSLLFAPFSAAAIRPPSFHANLRRLPDANFDSPIQGDSRFSPSTDSSYRATEGSCSGDESLRISRAPKKMSVSRE